MSTAGERLRALAAGRSGPAGALLLSIGSGSATGAILAGTSGIGAAPAWQHLMRAAKPDDGAFSAASLPSSSIRKRRGKPPVRDQSQARGRKDEILLWGNKWL